jgi:prepilin signal peptidase PulO-like enzyme (type II secretory pathway)
MGFVGGAKIAWLGLFIAYIAGSLIGLGVIAAKGRQNTMIPFGPALAIGLWISMVAYQPLMNWYIGLLTQ